METEKIVIANLKCGGCENTITKEISAMKGVDSVIIDHNEDMVTIKYRGNAVRADFVKKLHSLGYPEATEHNGLLMKLKSYKSCLVGRLTN